MAEEEEECDYDDPRFLLSASTPTTKDLSYAEKRKRDIIRGIEKGSSNNKKSLKQEEEERREEGLRTNLIVQAALAGDVAGGGGGSKALKMMKGMGFKPGEALGQKRSLPSPEPEQPPAEDEDLLFGRRGGIGSSKPASKPPPQARTEPISFQMRDRRTGLGVPSSKPVKASSTSSSKPSASASASTPLPDINLYLSRNKDQFDEKKTKRLLRSVKKTLEELDRKNGIEDSVMWKSPEDFEMEEKRERSRKRFRGEEFDDVDVTGEREIGAKGFSNYVVELDEEDDEVVEKDGHGDLELMRIKERDKEEEEEWLSFDPRVRLALTLAYLRKTYFYCVWCGCKYEDEDDLAKDCPGEDEKDHE